MKKVLIVDDAAFVRAALRNILEKNGFSVVGEAENGVKAVKKAEELQPDVITLDITMPEMDGIEALPLISKCSPDSKIVMVSALGQESFIKEAIIKGAKHFIVKPFQEATIVSVLNKITG